MLFEDAVIAYWDDKSRRLRGNTLEGYASAIRCHLMPAWEGRDEVVAYNSSPGAGRAFSIQFTQMDGSIFVLMADQNGLGLYRDGESVWWLNG